MGVPSLINVGPEKMAYRSGVSDGLAQAPDPTRFEIEQAEQVGDAVVALIHYPNCTNFEGRKIIIFGDTSLEEIEERKEIDPHFSEKGDVVARLRPDENGWENAVTLAGVIGQPGREA